MVASIAAWSRLLAMSRMQKAQACSGKLQALQTWEERQEAASRREGALEGKVQALEARLAATEASLQAHRHSGPSTSGIPRPPGLTKPESPEKVSGQYQLDLPLTAEINRLWFLPTVKECHSH